MSDFSSAFAPEARRVARTVARATPQGSSGCVRRIARKLSGCRQVFRPPRFEISDRNFVLETDSDVIESLKEAPTDVLVDHERLIDSLRLNSAFNEVDGDFSTVMRLKNLPQALDDRFFDLGREQSTLAGVALEDVGEPR